MNIGDAQLVGELLLVDTFEQLRTIHSDLTDGRWDGFIEELTEGTSDIHDADVASSIRSLMRKVAAFREAWSFVMVEGEHGFEVVCDELKLDPSYARRVVKEEFGLSFSTLVVWNAGQEYMKQREHHAGKRSRGDKRA